MQESLRADDPDANDRRQVALLGALIAATGAALPLTRAAASNPSSPSTAQLALAAVAVVGAGAVFLHWGVSTGTLAALGGLVLVAVPLWVILSGRAHIGAVIALVGGVTMLTGGLREVLTVSLGRDPGPYV